MQKVGKNKFTFYQRLFIPVLLIWFFKDHVLISIGKQTVQMIVFIGLFGLFLLLFLVIGLFFKPIKVAIDNDELIIYSYFGTTINLNARDITGYSTTTYLTASYKGYTGLLLYLENGKVVELTEYNIKSIEPICSAFIKDKIRYYGHEMSWFPFRPLKYKFKSK